MFTFLIVAFWVVIFITSFLVEYTIKTYKTGTPALFIIAVFVALCYFCGFRIEVMNTFNFVKENPGRTIVYAFFYVAIGFAWSLYKWYLFVKDAKSDYDCTDDEFYKKRYIPKTGDNKGSIISWMMYWPISITFFLVNNPIYRFFNYIYNKCTFMYDDIIARVFREKTVDEKNKNDYDNKIAEYKS